MPISTFATCTRICSGSQRNGVPTHPHRMSRTTHSAPWPQGLLAAAATGSGKSAAFLPADPAPADRKEARRRERRSHLSSRRRELAAQIDEHLRDLAVHTPLSGAAVFGRSAWGRRSMPSGAEWTARGHAGTAARSFPIRLTRSWRVLEITGARTRPTGCTGGMGCSPDIRRVLKHRPLSSVRRCFFSATLSQAIVGTVAGHAIKTRP